jgi:predicted enzyme related to lactoylglutathione lyase
MFHMLKSCACVVYVVKDLAQSRKWYEQNVGGQVVEDLTGWVGIKLESGQFVGLTSALRGQPAPAVCPFYLVDDLAAELRRLTAAGATLVHPTEDVGTVLIAVVLTPDGLPLGLHQHKAG